MSSVLACFLSSTLGVILSNFYVEVFFLVYAGCVYSVRSIYGN